MAVVTLTTLHLTLNTCVTFLCSLQTLYPTTWRVKGVTPANITDLPYKDGVNRLIQNTAKINEQICYTKNQEIVIQKINT